MSNKIWKETEIEDIIIDYGPDTEAEEHAIKMISLIQQECAERAQPYIDFLSKMRAHKIPTYIIVPKTRVKHNAK